MPFACLFDHTTAEAAANPRARLVGAAGVQLRSRDRVLHYHRPVFSFLSGFLTLTPQQSPIVSG